LAPDYEKLGTTFAGEPDVLIVKIDADKHKKHSPTYGVTGFPTLMWFGKHNKNGVKYTGGRTLEDLTSYVNSMANTNRLPGGALNDKVSLSREQSDVIASCLKLKNFRFVLRLVSLTSSLSWLRSS